MGFCNFDWEQCMKTGWREAFAMYNYGGGLSHQPNAVKYAM
jgi:hypothetical protein